jgi:PAS domain S-box-containing protein
MKSALLAASVVLLATASAGPHSTSGRSEHPGYLAAAVAVAGVQALFIGGLLLQRSRRHQAEARLQESKEVHRLTLASISDAVFITSPGGSFTFVCPNVAVIFGYTQREAEQLGNIRRLLGDAVPEPTVLDASGEISNLECSVLDKEGCDHHLLVNVKRICIKGGTRLYTCRDVTDRRRAEDANRRLAHAHRLAGMGGLTALIAHEVNQPLGAILADAEAAELLLENPDPPLGEMREILADIRKSDMRADSAIRHIRALLRRQEIKIGSLNLNDTVREVVRLAAADALRRQVRIRTELDPALPLAAGDAVDLQHVLLNLVINAMDSMVDTPSDAQAVVIRTRQGEPGSIEVTVADRGTGVPPDQLSTVFESFFTTKANGMGLGLSIARSIIAAHHGRIWVRNNDAGGATFHFTVPLGEKAAGRASR